MPQKTCQRLSIFATLLLIAAMIVLYRLDALFSENFLTIALQIIALGIMAWARWSFGRRSFHFAAQPTSEKLITLGIYKYLRHPIYAAIWLFCWAGVAASFSVINAGLALLVLMCLVIRIVCEEACLRRAFPDYQSYAQKTARLIPFIL
jgi:protein-S-isoprenylcysteine O-methyltransferase Ste14